MYVCIYINFIFNSIKHHLERCQFKKMKTTPVVKICIFLKAKRKYIQKISNLFYTHIQV